MSLPWRDPLTVWLSPGEVTVVRRNFGFRGFGEQVRAMRPEPCAQPPAWRSALDTLARSLDGSPGRSMRARVVLSNHFVRYVVARWRDELQTASERQAFVNHCFRETFGAAADGWTLREDPEAHGKASLACAIDAALLEALRDLFRRSHMRIASVQPLFMAAFNRHRRTVGERGAFFVYESGRLCGARFENAEWQSVSNARVESDAALPVALERELVLHGMAEDAPAYLCLAADSQAVELPARVTVLERRAAATFDAEPVASGGIA